MSNKKATKRALLSSIMAIFLCLSMLVGTTFAWFTDSASTAVNKIQAGTLDIALEMKQGDSWVSAEGQTLSFIKATGHENEEILWEPGCTYELPELRVVNNGNLALKYKIAITGIQGSAKLNEAIDWYMSVDGTPAENLNSVVDKAIEPNNNSGSIAIKGHMKEDAGNEYQGLSIEGIAITVYATQYTSEYDSDDNTYDAGAEYGTAVSTAAEFSSAIAAGKDVLLTSNIVLDSQLNITNDISIYGNGHTVISNKPVNVGADTNVTFKNVNFAAPTNTNNQASNLYATGLKGKLVLDGCTFSGAQWDCIQITPVAGAEIVINNCTFELNTPAQSGNKTRFIHIEAAYGSNADVKITMTNNFFGASTYINEALIDIDYINLAGIDFGGNNIYTDTDADIYVCGPSAARTITAAEAYARLGSRKVAFAFDNPTEAIAFCPDCSNDGTTANHANHREYIKIENGVANVEGNGAWLNFAKLDWDNNTYFLEYEVDLSDLANGAFVAFDSGETVTWQDLQLGFKRENDEIKAYNTLFAASLNENTKLGVISDNIHVVYKYSVNETNALEMQMVISDGVNNYTVQKTVNNFNKSANICWDVYTADGTSATFAKLDNLVFSSISK